MELIKQLSPSEQEEFYRVRTLQNGLEERTIEQSLKYYIEYKNNTSTHSHISPDKLSITFKAALFMAEKSTCCTTVNGERISEPSLTLGHLLRTHPLDEVMITLKDFTKNVTITDKEAGAELSNLIKEISFLITFHKKFQKSVEKFELKERHPESGEYVKYWSHLAWLLFIQVRSKLLNKSLDLIENTCMLAHTLAFMLSFSWDHALPAGLLRQEKKINEQSQLKEVFPLIRDRVLEMFSIKTMDIYTSLATMFETFFDADLIKKNVLKTHHAHSYDFLAPDLLQPNYRRLDKNYEKNMNGVDLDERVFLRERTANLTPSKFTPFARQGYANKGRRSGQNDAFRENCSHRVLNYEMIEKQQENTMKNGEVGMGRLPKTIVVSPSMMKVPLILATPISAGMEMLNYVNEKAKKFQETLSQGYINKKPHEVAALKQIELVFEKGKKENDKKAREAKEHMVYSFFKLALEEYLSQHPSEKDNEDCYRALMTLTIQLVLFANNSCMLFEDLEKEVGVHPFELWKACDFFLKFDKCMPASLKMHLLDIEVGLISHKMWRDTTFVDLAGKFARGEAVGGMEFVERWFRRLLHQTGFQIQQVGERLKMAECHLEMIYEVMKHIISEYTDLLHNRNIDQLIICSFFAVSKKEKLDLKFVEVIDAYKEANYYNRDMHDALLKDVGSEEDESFNLISFYNKCFLRLLKDYILNIKTSDHPQNPKKNNSNNPILMSPLKDILPKDLNKRNRLPTKTDGNAHKDLLIAYTDSPLLRHQPVAFKTKDARVTGMINFEEQGEILRNNIEQKKEYEKKEYEKNEKKDYERHSPRNVNNYTGEPSKKTNINNIVSGQSNLLWKQPETLPNSNSIGGLTPNRAKNMPQQPMVPLSQFSSNSSQSSNIPLSRTTSNSNQPPLSKAGLGQYGLANLGRLGRKN